MTIGRGRESWEPKEENSLASAVITWKNPYLEGRKELLFVWVVILCTQLRNAYRP